MIYFELIRKQKIIELWMNFLISLQWFSASVSPIRSILVCNIIIEFKFIISTAAKCSDVCGWGQVSLAAKIFE